MRSCSLVLSLAMILLMLVTMSNSAIAACSSCCSAPSCSAKTCHACDCNCGCGTALNSLLENLLQMVKNQNALLEKMKLMHETPEAIKTELPAKKKGPSEGAVQRLQIVADRIMEEDSRLARLAKEKQRAEAELQAKREELKAEAAKNAELNAQSDIMASELCKVKAEGFEWQGKLQAEEKKSAGLLAELELERKTKEELLASQQAEVDAAFVEGSEDAAKIDTDQITALNPKLFRLGCEAVLKKMGVPEDNPIYQNLPEFGDEPPAEAPAEAPATSAEAPAEPTPVPSEAAPPADDAPGENAVIVIEDVGAAPSS